MPELPEVEIYRQYIEQHALRKRISSLSVEDPRILAGVTPRQLQRRLVGHRFDRTLRHGKHLFVRAARDSWLHLHFGMTGDVLYFEADEKAPRFSKVTFHFAGDRHLAYEDMRLFGRVSMTESPEATISERRLGLDPLDPSFRGANFVQLLKGRSSSLKSLLMRQDLIAGMGNLYVDETLYQAELHPSRPAESVSDDRLEKIFTVMRSVLTTTIDRKKRGLNYPSRYLTRRRETGAPCPRCGGEIEKTVVFGRTTYFCGRHQR